MKNGCRVQRTNNDVELLELIRNQDDHVFDLLYKNYWHSLLRFAAQYLQDEDTCEDIVQELFVHLHSRHVTWQVRFSLSSYLRTALRNRIVNYMRNRAVYKKHVLLSNCAGPTKQNNVEQFLDMIDLQKEIALSLKQMPFKYREVYLLHQQNYLTIKKIALVLKRPVDTVEKQLRKATTLLRNHLTESKMYAVK